MDSLVPNERKIVNNNKQITTNVFFWNKFSLYFDIKIRKILGICVFPSVISTNFATYGANLTKIWTSQIWKKKHWSQP
jgi:hypothetical protein